MKVLIVDDSAIMRERLIAMLSEITELENISQVKDSLEAIRTFEKLHPEVVDTGYTDAWRKWNRRTPKNQNRNQTSPGDSPY